MFCFAAFLLSRCRAHLGYTLARPLPPSRSGLRLHLLEPQLTPRVCFSCTVPASEHLSRALTARPFPFPFPLLNNYPSAESLGCPRSKAVLSLAMMSLLSSLLRLGGPPKTMDPCPCAFQDSLTIVEKADVLQDQLADARSEKAQWLVRSIVDTHAELLKLPHLRPGKAINQLLGDLVSICSEIHDRAIVEKVIIPGPQRLETLEVMSG